ncbi:MAG: PLP-dependent transferase [Gemmatimonas sp.]|uniref:PLP-dependent transferase n=1 Tax=Gemmatimonas sp. TaxID=1962908 RepID=UPI00391F9ECA
MSAVMESLEHRLAVLEGADAALVLASGRAATACTILALLRTGDHLLACGWLRPETRAFFDTELPALGVAVSFIDPRDTRGWRRELRKTTRALFVESPVVESGRLVDLRPPRTLAQELGIAFIVDATAASPLNFTPLRHGADVVVHDARLLLDQEGTADAGVVCGTEAVVDEVRRKMAMWGAVPHPAARSSLALGLDTLAARVEQVNATARHVAMCARSAPGVRRVLYSGLPDDPDHPACIEWMHGAGPVVLLELEEPAHVGLLCHQLSTYFGRECAVGASGVTQARALSTDGLVRLQVGLEDPTVIVTALVASLTAAPSSPLAEHH